MSSLNEVQQALENNTTLSSSSKSVYRSNYKRLMSITDNEPIKNFSQKRIIEILDNADIPASSKNGMVTIVLLIRNMDELDSEKIIEFREKKVRRDRYKEKEAQNRKLQLDLPSLDTLEKYTKHLLNEGDYVSYIVNFLLLRFGVRNRDLNILITTDKSKTYVGNKAKMNYLYVTHKYITYIRNDYKTFDTYGRKVHKMELRLFVRAVKEVLGDKVEVPLLASRENDDVISESSLSQTIQRKTFDQLGEGKYFKIILQDLKKKGNIKKIRDIAKTRGTDLETIFAEYDIAEKV